MPGFHPRGCSRTATDWPGRSSPCPTPARTGSGAAVRDGGAARSGSALKRVRGARRRRARPDPAGERSAGDARAPLPAPCSRGSERPPGGGSAAARRRSPARDRGGSSNRCRGGRAAAGPRASSMRRTPGLRARPRMPGRPEVLQDELDAPILAELFSVERLEEHAQSLATAQTVTARPGRGHPIRPRVTENGHVLLESYRGLPPPSRKSDRSRRPRNGSWTISRSSTSSCARSATTCPPTTTASSRSSRGATSRDIPGSWPGMGLCCAY